MFFVNAHALDVGSNLGLLKGEPAGSCAKDLESFKIGKQHNQTKHKSQNFK